MMMEFCHVSKQNKGVFSFISVDSEPKVQTDQKSKKIKKLTFWIVEI